MALECFVCAGSLKDDASKCWLVETDPRKNRSLVSSAPVHKACAARMVNQRGPLGNTVTGYQKGQSKPNGYGLIERR